MSVEALFSLDPIQRSSLFKQLGQVIERYFSEIAERPVKQPAEAAEIDKEIAQYDFEKPTDLSDALSEVVQSLERYQTHFGHPSYFGMFDPAVTPAGVLADALVAAYNPQLASAIQSAFPITLEKRLINELAIQLGLSMGQGCFTTGGSEANHTAVLLALTHQFSEFKRHGVRGLSAQPTLYLSTQAHHSFHKIARMCGLGDESVREISVDENLQMDLGELQRKIQEDRKEGFLPFFVVGTIGTTAAGIIEPLADLALLCREEKLWFHVDGAWGGAVALVPQFRSWVTGLAQADSLTLDAHKWLSVPMGAGVFLTTHQGLILKTFQTQAGYIPKSSHEYVEPYQSSIQWSRRFIGLKLFLTLRQVGWSGYRQKIFEMVELGNFLRESFRKWGWEVVGKTPLPVVCVTRKELDSKKALEFSQKVVASGKAWVSSTEISHNQGRVPVLRAAVTNFRTSAATIGQLVETLTELVQCE